ncbi:calcium-binding protein [Jannaschia aquimarina]|uniref:AlgE1_2 protein n=1 Tax=Jannaschia aquimarina TaxID=935700 RepID=A0A0D1EFY0_9RHOB|nr:calcium-binding protein [Jannaschia aquimarina]KIT14760.1 Poly(beta-D-mannuronate) C5 epimerase 1 [Jannaschia aquimarina]SNT42061.1 Ca2+-binding protein, RTX toxin-related [Jannaschia aquimarina]
MQISIMNIRATDKIIGPEYFGGNTVYRANIDLATGLPTEAYMKAAEQLDLTHLRFPAGQTETFFENGVVIDNDIPPDLRAFLTWARSAEEGPYTVSIVLPTDKSYTGPKDIQKFAEIVLRDYSDIVTAFEIGNEYWGPIDHEITAASREAEYGRIASEIAEAISKAELEVGRDEAMDVLIQTANPSGASSNYHFAKVKGQGLTEKDRWDMANREIAAELSDAAISEIDGIVHHFYWADYHADEPSNNLGYRMDWHRDAWGDVLGPDLEFHVTEWNVMASNRALLGMKSGGAIVQMFSDMLSAGVDHAQIWPPKHNTRNDLAGGNTRAVVYDDRDIVTNSIQGAVFDLMSSSLIGLSPLELTVEGADTVRIPSTEILIHGFGNEETIVFYLSSTDEETQDIVIDPAWLSHGLMFDRGLKVGIDQSTSDGVMSFESSRSEDVEVIVSRGKTYFTNEDDVGALISEVGTVAPDGSLSLTLAPYEIVELTFSYDEAIFAENELSREAIHLNGSPSDDDFEVVDIARSIKAGLGNDTIRGGSFDDILSGASGRDTIFAGAGNDGLYGGNGEDVLYGGHGDDLIIGAAQGDIMTGGAGADTFLIREEDFGPIADRITDFELGVDLIHVAAAEFENVADLHAYWNESEGGSVVVFNHSSGGKSRILVEGITPHEILQRENFEFGADLTAVGLHLLGTSREDTLSGSSGNDTLDGGYASDLILAGAGDDRITVADGADLANGGSGDDVILLNGSETFDQGYSAYNASSMAQTGTGVYLSIAGKKKLDAVVFGKDGADVIQLSDDSDAFFLHDNYSEFHGSLALAHDTYGRMGVARFVDVETILGMGGDDVIDLTSPDYSLAGMQMLIDGGTGNDIIWGSDATEVLLGGNGDDTLFGGVGGDTLVGGAGADIFELTRTSSGTVIKDFDPSAGDMIKVYGLEAVDSIDFTDRSVIIQHDSGSLHFDVIGIDTITQQNQASTDWLLFSM